MFSNLELMRDARRALGPHWGLGVLITFIYLLIVGIPSLLFADFEGLISIILSGPFSVGFAYFSFSVIYGETPHLNQLFKGFDVFGKSFLAYLCYAIMIVVGVIFFIIPGIIVSLGFSLTFYVMADRPELSFSECLYESWQLTSGYRLKVLGLWLRFFPWYILGALCLGVGVLLVIPWHYTAVAKLYQQLKREKM